MSSGAPRRSVVRVRLAAFVFLALAAGLAWWWFSKDSQPSYLGRSPSQWFPRWTHELAFDAAAEFRQNKLLAEAGPEAIPMLAAAARAKDSALALRYAELRRCVPAYISHLALPVYREAEVVRYGVGRTIKSMCGRPETLRALTNHWDEFPVEMKHRVVEWLAQPTEASEIAEPFLLRQLRGDEPSLASEAALALCRYPVAAREFAELATRLRDLPTNRWEEGAPPLGAEVATILVELGPAAATARPMLEDWLKASSPRVRAWGVLGLASVAPEPGRFAALVQEHVIGKDASLVDVLALERVRRTRGRLAWAELVPVLTPLLDGVNAADAEESSAWRALGVLAFLGELGPEAASAWPAVVARMRHPLLGAQAAHTLARFGPQVPESVPSWVDALGRLETAGPLMLLLAAYGPRAAAALPVLEALASGDREWVSSPVSERRGSVPFVAPGSEPGRSPLPPPIARTDVSPRDLRVPASLARRLGLVAAWPSPQELGAAPGLVWAEGMFDAPLRGGRRSTTNLATGTVRIPYATYDQLARHALRCLRGEAGGAVPLSPVSIPDRAMRDR